MKKLLFIAFTILCIKAYSQVPQSFSYQAVARDISGNVLQDKDISLQISILDISTTGIAQYVETHNVKTNQFGLFNLSIGTGTVVSGIFANITWASGNKFLKVELDVDNGINYTLVSTTQLLSVPYAMYSGNGTQWSNNDQTIYYNNGSVGVGTNQPKGKLVVVGNSGSTDPIFEVQNELGETVFAVYPDGVKMVLKNDPTSPTSGLSVNDNSGMELFRVTSDSTVVAFNETTTKGTAKGKGFVIKSGSKTKGTNNMHDYFRLTPDSTNIFFNSNTNGNKTGFYVGKREGGNEKQFFKVTQDSTQISTDCPDKSVTIRKPCANVPLLDVGGDIKLNQGNSAIEGVMQWTGSEFKMYKDGKWISVSPIEVQNDNWKIFINDSGKVETRLVDIEGNMYKTVKIGAQIWTAENLKVTKYSNGDPITNVTDNTVWSSLTTEAYSWYNNDYNTYGKVYGALYNWYAASDIRNVCPTGWHVPSSAEWSTLTTYLGGTNVAGGKMKETGTVHWLSTNVGATNESGFTGLGAGGRTKSPGQFYNIGAATSYWSSTMDGPNFVFFYNLLYLDQKFTQYSDLKPQGCSIRCIKD